MTNPPIALIAVYGSLRRDNHTGRQYLKERSAKFRDLGPCVIKDCSLYFVKSSIPFNYPTTKPNTPGKEVQANLLVVDAECLAHMDRYEGYPNLFTRSVVKVKLENGNELSAIMYHLNNERMAEAEQSQNLELIEDGDWLKFYQQRGLI